LKSYRGRIMADEEQSDEEDEDEEANDDICFL
jgi:hypothetical protein